MACLWGWSTPDYRLLDRLRAEVRREMVAAGFQIGGKFDTVLERRARKRYGLARATA